MGVSMTRAMIMLFCSALAACHWILPLGNRTDEAAFDAGQWEAQGSDLHDVGVAGDAVVHVDGIDADLDAPLPDAPPPDTGPVEGGQADVGPPDGPPNPCEPTCMSFSSTYCKLPCPGSKAITCIAGGCDCDGVPCPGQAIYPVWCAPCIKAAQQGCCSIP